MAQTLLRLPGFEAIDDRLLAAKSVHAPQHMMIEVAQTLRRFEFFNEIAEAAAGSALDALLTFRVTLYEPGVLLQRIWTLRRNFTCYDAAYVALAELLGAPLLTRDRRLAAAPGHNARIEIL